MFQLSVDHEEFPVQFESSRPSPVAPGWTEHFGRAGHSVPVRLWVHDSSPLLMMDVFNGRNDGSKISVGLDDAGVWVDLYPGAGFGTIIGLPAPISDLVAGTPSPVAGDLVNEQGSKYPDVIATGGQSSPRNKFVPGFLSTKLDQAPWHAALFATFQLARPLQRIPKTWDQGDSFGFDGFAYHEDQYPISSGSPAASFKILAQPYPTPMKQIAPAKHWELQKFQTWSKTYGYLTTSIDRYTQSHFTISELISIYLRWRDPRSYDQARRAFLGFHAWAWQCSPNVGTWNYGEVSRVKGRCLESCFWMIQGARLAGDTETENLAVAIAKRHAERMIELRHEKIKEGYVTPSVTPGLNDHLNEPFDCSFFIAVYLWGSALMARLGGPDESLFRNLADFCASSLETTFYSNGKFILDAPATGDISRAKYYPKFDGGTIAWPLYGGYALGLVGKSEYFTKLEAGVRAAGYGINDPFAPGAPMEKM